MVISLVLCVGCGKSETNKADTPKEEVGLQKIEFKDVTFKCSDEYKPKDSTSGGNTAYYYIWDAKGNVQNMIYANYSSDWNYDITDEDVAEEFYNGLINADGVTSTNDKTVIYINDKLPALRYTYNVKVSGKEYYVEGVAFNGGNNDLYNINVGVLNENDGQIDTIIESLDCSFELEDDVESSEAEDDSDETDPYDSLSTEEQNAYDKAVSYLEYSSFSKQGLIEQLEFEGYPKKAAKRAIKALEENDMVSWSKQAEEKAKSYLEYSSFSKQGLVEQLEFEKFTHKQAVKAVEKVYK